MSVTDEYDGDLLPLQIQLSDADMATLKQQSQGTYDKYAPEINQIYPNDTYKPDNFLKEVQGFLN